MSSILPVSLTAASVSEELMSQLVLVRKQGTPWTCVQYFIGRHGDTFIYI